MMPSAGFDISDEGVRFVEFERKPHGLVVSRFGERTIPTGLIAEGYVNDKDKVIEIFRSLAKDIGTQFVRATLPEERSYIFHTSLPRAAKDAMASAIEFKIQENVPIPPVKAIFDYEIVSGGREGDSDIGVSVTVVQRSLVETYTEILKAAGLIPTAFKIASQAIARAVAPSYEGEASLVIHVGDTKTILFIVEGGIVQFSSTLKVGSATFINLIEKYFKVSRAEAEKIKRQRIFSAGQENEELLFSLASSLSVVKDEMAKLMRYWQERSGAGNSATIAKVILSGEDAILAEVDRYLSLESPISFGIAQVWRNAFSLDTYIPPLSLTEALNYAAAIGLALPPPPHIHHV